MLIKRWLEVYREGEGLAGGGAPTAALGALAGGGAPAANPNPAPAGGVPNPGANASDWFAPEYKDLVSQKGWDNPNKALEGYSNLERLLGEKANAVILPKADGKPEEWNAIYDKLGRPKDAAEYKLPVPQDANPEFAKTAAQWFHENGLNNKQAEGIVNKFNEYTAAAQTKDNEAFVAKSNQELGDLRDSLGAKFDDTMELSRRATRLAMEKSGLTMETLGKLEQAVGTKTMLSMFAEFGKMMTEATGPDGNMASAFQGTPDYAKGMITKLRGDAGFRERYNSNDPNIRNLAIDEMSKWQKQAHGDAPTT